MFLEQDPCLVAGPGRRPVGDPDDGLCGARLAAGLADSARRAARVRVLPADSPLTPASLLEPVRKRCVSRVAAKLPLMVSAISRPAALA